MVEPYSLGDSKDIIKIVAGCVSYLLWFKQHMVLLTDNQDFTDLKKKKKSSSLPSNKLLSTYILCININFKAQDKYFFTYPV